MIDGNHPILQAADKCYMDAGIAFENALSGYKKISLQHPELKKLFLKTYAVLVKARTEIYTYQDQAAKAKDIPKNEKREYIVFIGTLLKDVHEWLEQIQEILERL